MVKIRAHWDADGIISGHFATFGIPNSILEIGIHDKGFGNTEGLSKEDWMVDMKPSDPSWNGTCIDHHFPHPKERKYTLIPNLPDDVLETSNSIVPASLITWNYFKDKIPKEEWWKLVIGICGDGQPELIPNEVYMLCPSLLKYVSTSVYQSYGNWKISSRPLYETLSSAVNSFLRKGDSESAMNLIKYSSSPMDIYNSEDVRYAKQEVRSEFMVAIKDANVIHFSNLAVIIFQSKFRMSGYIASSIQKELDGKTIMAINKNDGSLSLRGNLAYYFKERLKDIPYLEIDGHKGFCGGKLKKSYSKLISDMSEILQ